jgi:transketolase
MSVRKAFVKKLFVEMQNNKDIILLTADLGYKVFDEFRTEFPDRFINVGAAEQLLIGTGIGLAMDNKIPICYSMTPFLLYRPFELIRNYVDYEKIPVKLIGSGRDKDYLSLGWSHWSTDDKEHLSGFKNIKKYWPKDQDEVDTVFHDIIYNNNPTYVNLSR